MLVCELWASAWLCMCAGQKRERNAPGGKGGGGPGGGTWAWEGVAASRGPRRGRGSRSCENPSLGSGRTLGDAGTPRLGPEHGLSHPQGFRRTPEAQRQVPPWVPSPGQPSALPDRSGKTMWWSARPWAWTRQTNLRSTWGFMAHALPGAQGTRRGLQPPAGAGGERRVPRRPFSRPHPRPERGPPRGGCTHRAG